VAVATIAATPEILLASDTAAATERVDLPEILTIVCGVVSIPLIILLWRWNGWRPPREDGRPAPTPWRPSPLASGLTFVAFLLIAPLLVQLVFAELTDLDPILRNGLQIWTASAFGLLFALPVAVLAMRRPRPAGAPALSPFPTILPVGVLAFLVLFPLVMSTQFLGGLAHTMLTGEPPEILGHETLQLLREMPLDLGWWAIASGVVIAAPWQEEVMFRGMLQQTFRKSGIGPWLSIAITASLFTIMHVPAIPDASRMSVLPGLLLLSIGLGVLRERTGRISTCVVAHAAFNLVNLSLSFAVDPAGG